MDDEDVAVHPPGFSAGSLRHHPRNAYHLDSSHLHPDLVTDPFEVFSLAFTNDSRVLACGGANNVIRVYTAHDGAHSHNLVSDGQSLPCTAIRFRPSCYPSAARDVLLAASADGSVSHWHLPSQTCIFRIEEQDNQVFAADYSPDGTTFATAGRDAKVRVYDEETKTLTATLAANGYAGATSLAGAGAGGVSGGSLSSGHTNRVFALKHDSGNPHVLFSAGWDNTVIQWDIRAPSTTTSSAAVRTYFGPHVCGDAIDVSKDGKMLLTGSCRPDNALQLWDIGSGRVLCDLDAGGGVGGRPLMPYACSFSPDDTHIAAGGSGDSAVRVYAVTGAGAGAGAGVGASLCDRIEVDPRGVYAVRWSPNGEHLAATGKSPTAVVVHDVNYTVQGEGDDGGDLAAAGESGAP